MIVSTESNTNCVFTWLLEKRQFSTLKELHKATPNFIGIYRDCVVMVGLRMQDVSNQKNIAQIDGIISIIKQRKTAFPE